LTGFSVVLCDQAMKAIFRTLTLLLIAAPLVAREEPAMRIVVLDNENLLVGEVSRVEDGWRILQPVGGDIVLPPKRVLAIVADRPAAFRAVAARANLRDADERLRLAKWCWLNDLPDEALRQAEAAVTMRPDFPAASQLLGTLRSVKAATPAPTSIVPVKAEKPLNSANTVSDIPTVDFNSVSFPLFASRVHAILLNACASCHSRDDVKVFRLQKQSGRAAISRNLMSALAQINPNDPAKSPLLLKAVTPHGTATEAPFRTRNHPAYVVLEAWAMIARAPEGSMEPAIRVEFNEPKRLPILDKSQPPAAKTDSFGAARLEAPAVNKPGSPVDPFDPSEFNKSSPAKEKE
jgi:hypothetical protein